VPCGRFIPTDDAAGAGAGQDVLGNGDVNGDSDVNLSDVIYLLAFLFQGGDPPELCPASGPETDCDNGLDDDQDGDTDCDDSDCALDAACPQIEQGDPSLLPDTGQTICTDELGQPIDCDDVDCPGQDGAYSTGCPRTGEARFVDNLDGTVTDNCTGLMWQQFTADVARDGFLDEFDSVTWCETLDFADNDDWRLPNINELQSLVDHGEYNPATDPIFGMTKLNSTGYWTSTSQQGFLAWIFLSEVGLFSTGSGHKTNTNQFVRAVRNAP